MKKIIHLSDLHVGHENCGDKFRAIIENIAFLKQPAKDYVIVITGDIVDNANHQEYIDEAVGIIELAREYGYTVLVVPGNHDYGNGAIGDKKFVDLFKKNYFKSNKVTYPKLDIIGRIAFIGLDSMAEELHWHDRFFSEGELGQAQLKRLKKMLKKSEVAKRRKVIYLHHHPFDFKLGMQLKDNKDLKDIIENRIDMLLFGHYHADPVSAGKIYHGAWGIRRCYNGGSSTHKNGDTGFQRVINLANKDPRKDYDGNFI
ncbi:MAG: metallophosphoesterase [Bacteroidota bacterium]|nr:metallophosphoesterase [Bacteroidota bacterium]